MLRDLSSNMQHAIVSEAEKLHSELTTFLEVTDKYNREGTPYEASKELTTLLKSRVLNCNIDELQFFLFKDKKQDALISVDHIIELITTLY